jgi:hypothetical protein
MATRTYTTTKICRVLVELVVLWGIIGLLARGSWAYDHEAARATLRGLPGVRVYISPLSSDIERAGLSLQQLQTDVELRIRQAGIPVLTEEERRVTLAQPWLNVQLIFVPHPITVPIANVAVMQYIFSIHIEVRRRASFPPDFSSADVATWSTSFAGFVGEKALEGFRNYVRDIVDQFINAYLSVNPRPAGSVAPAAASSQR